MKLVIEDESFRNKKLEKSKNMYNCYIETLSKKFNLEIETISADYNFEYGDEFEIALCNILRLFLPDKYGVCRGHVVSADGDSAGDDIIIYDKYRIPTLKLRERNDFARKENIPVEAVYCYIEAKHTLYLQGTPKDKRQSLAHAFQQVTRAKEVIAKRAPVSMNHISPHTTISGANWTLGDFHPGIQNAPFAAILSRYVKDNDSSSGKIIIHGSEVIISINKSPESSNFLHANGPDYIGLGPNLSLLPYVNGPNGIIYVTFNHPQRLAYNVVETPGLGFGMGLLSIMTAIDRMMLGIMPWTEIMSDTMSKHLVEAKNAE